MLMQRPACQDNEISLWISCRSIRETPINQRESTLPRVQERRLRARSSYVFSRYISCSSSYCMLERRCCSAAARATHSVLRFDPLQSSQPQRLTYHCLARSRRERVGGRHQLVRSIVSSRQKPPIRHGRSPSDCYFWLH